MFKRKGKDLASRIAEAVKAEEVKRKRKKVEAEERRLVKSLSASLEGREVLERYRLKDVPVDVVITSEGEYLVQEPPLDEARRKDIEQLLSNLVYLLPEASARLEDLDIDPVIKYYLEREVYGYGLLDAAMRDPNVEDVNVTSAYAPVVIRHARYGNLETNIYFDGEEEVLRLAERLAHRAGKTVSAFVPIVSIRLPEGHRLTITYGREVSHRGTGIAIRKFPEKPWSITRVMARGTLDPATAALAMVFIETKMAGVIFGVMGSGKTSLINALCNLMPRNARIGTIEDAPELRLAHPFWSPFTTRESATVDRRGEITQFQLLKHALRHNLDYIIVGEVRGEEGAAWAQTVLTGHGGLTSFHAAGPDELIQRLTSAPINLEMPQLRGVHFMIHIASLEIEKQGRLVPARRVIASYNPFFREEDYTLTKLSSYDPSRDAFKHVKPEQLVKLESVKRLMELRGWDEARFLRELDLRERFMQLLLDKARLDEAYTDYEAVTKMVWEFHHDPSKFNLDLVKLPEKLYM